MLNHPDPRRREDGSQILGRLKSLYAIERHVALLSDSDWGVVTQAAKSLGQIGGREAKSAVGAWATRIARLSAEVSANNLPAAHSAAAEVLGKIRPYPKDITMPVQITVQALIWRSQPEVSHEPNLAHFKRHRATRPGNRPRVKES